MTPDAKLRFIGWYSDHTIRIFEDDHEQPWLVVFESAPVSLVDSEGHEAATKIKYDEVRERTSDAAQQTARALAQNSYLKHLPFQAKIVWRPM